MNINLKGLIGKLNEPCRHAMEAAAGLCLTRTHYDVDLEHLFVKLLEMSDTDWHKILRYYGVDQSRLLRDLTKSLDRLKTGNSRTPALSPRIPQLINEAWTIASIECDVANIRSGHLFLAMLSNEGMASLARAGSPEFAKVSAEDLHKNFQKIVTGSGEDREQQSVSAVDGGQPGAPVGSKTPGLDQFTIDLTDRARKGQIDPVLGRDIEIRQLVDILTRRRQNNPILTGEAGVGKTAVVEVDTRLD